MKSSDKTPYSVVMGHTETALSIARALGRRGIKVIGVGGKRRPATYSRFMTFVNEPQTKSEDERLQFFINLGKNFKTRAVILPTLDPNVMFLSRNRDVLAQYYFFLLPSHDLLKFITSKLGFIDTAKKYKIPLPPSIRIKNKSDLKKLPLNFFPCVLKPESQQAWLTEKAYKIGISGLKAIPAMNEFDLLTQYDRIKEADPKLIAQKMIIGPDENHLDYHALIDNDGSIQGEFVGKKFRLTPPHFGMGCYVKSVKSDKVVNEGRRILRLLNYRGMANINFKKDERDGRLYFLELNPRFSFWTGLDVACGADFPYYYYKICLGEKSKKCKEYLVGKRWLSLTHDLKGLRIHIKDGSLTWRHWILSVIKTDVGAIFAFDDPLPSIFLLVHLFKRGIRKIFQRITGEEHR